VIDELGEGFERGKRQCTIWFGENCTQIESVNKGKAVRILVVTSEARAVNVGYLMGQVILGQFVADYFGFFLQITVHSHLVPRLTCQIGPTSNHVIAFSSLRRSSVGA
jgi:hypothetical protein